VFAFSPPSISTLGIHGAGSIPKRDQLRTEPVCELLGTHLDVAENAAKRADFQEAVSVNGDRCPLFSTLKEVVTAPNAHQ
jgi:hypothetical protein